MGKIKDQAIEQMNNETEAKKPMPKRHTIERGLQEFKFDEQHTIFRGIFQATEKIGVGSKEKPEGFDMHVFVDFETGEEVYLSNVHAITKTIENIKSIGNPADYVLEFEWLGKTVVKGKPFNKFATGYYLVSDFNE